MGNMRLRRICSGKVGIGHLDAAGAQFSGKLNPDYLLPFLRFGLGNFQLERPVWVKRLMAEISRKSSFETW